MCKKKTYIRTIGECRKPKPDKSKTLPFLLESGEPILEVSENKVP